MRDRSRISLRSSGLLAATASVTLQSGRCLVIPVVTARAAMRPIGIATAVCRGLTDKSLSDKAFRALALFGKNRPGRLVNQRRCNRSGRSAGFVCLNPPSHITCCLINVFARWLCLVKIGPRGVVFPHSNNARMQAGDCDARTLVCRDGRMKKPGTLRVRA
jgi:hypothetical protein